MFKRKNGLFQNVSPGLALSLPVFFGIPSALPAEEKTGEIDGLPLYGLRNPEIL